LRLSRILVAWDIRGMQRSLLIEVTIVAAGHTPETDLSRGGL
jgi:hypothetical protein